MNSVRGIDWRGIAVGAALWLVAAAYLILNLSHIQLVLTETSDAPDSMHIYYSRNAMWWEPESSQALLAAGSNEVGFRMPALLTGNLVRFDPGRRAATYRISSVRWRCGGAEIPVPIEQVLNARPDASQMTISGSELVLVAHDVSPQLIIPVPDWSARIIGAHWLLALVLAAAAFVALAVRRRWALPRIAAALLGTCALVYFVACLAVGPRLPLFDDWRYVVPGRFNLIDGGWQWLTVSGNDTYFLTNQVLDFLVLKFSRVDFAWMRGVAVALLMLQLALQYRVVSRAAKSSPAVAAVAVALGIWSLAAGAYWGGTAIAYQQCLPTLFGTVMLAHLVARDGSLRYAPSLGVLVPCCIASGLAYISGGVLLAALGLAYLLALDLKRAPRPAVRAALVVIAAGILLLLLQFVLVSMRQGSLLDHNHRSPSIYPTDWRFWMFFFALFGRALGYGGPFLSLDIFCTVLVLFPGVAIGLQRLRALVRGRSTEQIPTWTLLAVYAAIGSAIYAAMVSFGRSGMGPPDATAAMVAAMGKGRFHYWPIAAMLPYIWLGWVALVYRLRVGARFVGACIAAVLLMPKTLMLLDGVTSFREVNRLAHDGARCTLAHMADVQAGRPVICTELTGVPQDMSGTLAHLREIKSHLYDEIIREGSRTPQ